MRMILFSVDHAPEELYDQLPLVVDLIRPLVEPNRPEAWVGRLERPVEWFDDGVPRDVTHVVVAARWIGDRVEPRATPLPVNLSYVIDPSWREGRPLDVSQCSFVAIGMCNVTA